MFEDREPLAEHKNIYNQKIELGKEIAKNSTVGIAALARNIESVATRNLKVLNDTFLKYFKDYEFFIYENDSEDDTVELLQQWSQKDNHNFVSEKLNAPKFGTSTTQERLKVMSNGRNICKNNLSTNNDYILVIDLDFISTQSVGLLNSIGWLQEQYISAMAGFSYTYRIQALPEGFKTQNPIWTNYDSWAYRHTHWEDLYSKGEMYWFWWWLPKIGLIPWSVNSAFGGSCLYKSKYYFSADYDHYDCEHVTHFFNIKKNDPSFNLFVNPSQSMIV